MRRSQSSLIELLIIAIAISVSLTLILSIRTINTSVNNEGDKVLINYLKYDDNALMILKQINNNSFFNKDSMFFNQSCELIEYLNNNNSFILFINSTSNDYTIYNKQSTVCLQEARLSTIVINEATITYGSWSGEQPLIC